MTSSTKTTASTTDMAGLKEARPYVVGQLGRTDTAFGQMQGGMAPGGIVDQGKGFVSDVLGGKYLDPASNPYLQKYAQGAIGDVTSQFNAMMSKAGRGNFTGGDAQQNLAAGIMSAAAPIYYNAYNQGMGQMQNMALAAPSYNVAAYGAPTEWANQQFGNLSNTGRSGTTTSTETSTPSAMQTIAGAALTGLGAFTANPQMMGSGMASLAGTPAGNYGYGGYGMSPATLPWMQQPTSSYHY